MAKKRGNSEGSLHQLPSGSWRAQVTLEGHRLSHTSQTHREALEWLKKITRRIDDGLTYTYSKLTLEEYLKDWLTGKKPSVRPSTWVQFEQVTRKYINPFLGQSRFINIRTEHIQSLYNQLLERNVGVYAVRKCHTVLHCAFEHAVRIEMLYRNPARYADPPRLPSSEMAILDESQVSQLLVTASGHRLGTLIHVAVVTRARQSEILGLKWTDLDWLKRSLKFERQLEKTFRTGALFSGTKTRYGRRSVLIGGHTIDLLRQHLEQQQQERLAAGDQWHENGLIFSTSVGTPVIQQPAP